MANARYHVVARANRKEMIFEEHQARMLFLQVLSRAKKRFSFTIENLSVMGNHYHLIIRPAHNENLSRILQWIMSVFATGYNRLHALTGHVWGERFFSRIIRNLREYLAISEYIDENPVKAGLVRLRSEWPFGGIAIRRSGERSVVDRLPPYLSLLMPAHGALLL